MTMLERMARAMYEAEPGVSPLVGPQWEWEFMVSEGWSLPETFRRRARAALLAIRNPTDQMVDTGYETDQSPCAGPHADIHPGDCFTAMIDAVLAEKPE